MTHWSEISADPNDREVKAWRHSQLRNAQRPPVKSRVEFIRELAQGKRVLDIGCVDQVGASYQIAPLHRAIAPVAKHCVGLDVDEAGISELAREGFAVKVADITQPGISEVVGQNWDLVVAGEIVEHLLDVGTLLRNARSVLAPTGRLILSTPNPHSFELAWYNFRGRADDNVDHVAYYWPMGMLEVANRTGFELESFQGEGRLVGRRHILHYAVGRIIARLSPVSQASSKTIIYVLKPVNS